MMTEVRKEKYLLFLIAILNFILSPIIIALIPINPEVIITVNFTLLILSGLLLAIKKMPQVLSLIFGLSTLFFIWIEFYNPLPYILALRICCSFVFFLILFSILARNILTSSGINLKIAYGTIAGYILLGILGGLMFEFLELSNPGSLSMVNNESGYTYYYFSFISLSTIGYGDIIPKSPLSQAVTILISILGQFYMVIGVGLFVGKFTSSRKK